MLRETSIPWHAIALLEALQFGVSRPNFLRTLDEVNWRRLLALTDASQLTLLLGRICMPHLPDWVQKRIERNYLDNACRFQRLKNCAFEIADSLSQRCIEFTVLKGFTHSPHMTPDPRLRAQGDIDLWCRPDKILNAKAVLMGLGYLPIGRSKSRHLDPMMREKEWEWRGDYFARDLPIPVDLHYKLWDERLECIPGPDENAFWDRRSDLALADCVVPALDPVDAVAFAALHVMMHLLRGDFRLQRAWELGYVLHTRALDEQFWIRWQASQPAAATRRIQTVALLLADYWFNCGIPEPVKEEVDALPEDVFLWIKYYGLSPIQALFVPNKDELWLHWLLLDSFRDKLRVAARRLLPVAAARARVDAEIGRGSGGRKKAIQRSKVVLKRAAYHVRLLPVSCVRAFRWWWLGQNLDSNYLQFLVSSGLFDLGEFVFFLLYNLYLVDRGFKEAFLGQVAAAVTAGTFVAVLPAGALTLRIGLRNAVILALCGTAVATTLRAIVSSESALLCSAFMNGVFMSFWAVSLPPAVAGLTNPRNRPLAFSLITSIGIGIGAIAAWIGGCLPALLVRIDASLGVVGSKRAALLAGSAVALLAAIPATRLKFPRADQRDTGKRIYPRSRFICAFLAAIFVWSIGTGGFNPFFNVYFFRHLHLPVEQIGYIASYAQTAQVFVILLAPAVAKRLGEVKSITYMQLATAAMLFLLALASNPVLAAAAYVAYMCFQYMSEPCLFSMLMTRVTPSEQSGASALNFSITSLASAIAAIFAGKLFANAGYGLTLAGCAAVIVLAAGLFQRLVRR